MPISRDKFLRNIDQAYAAKLKELRDRAEKTAQEAMAAGRDTFGVSVPDGVTSEMEDDVIREWEQEGWTITRSNARNERMLNFVPNFE